MRLIFTMLAALLFASPAFAQNLDPRYRSVGNINVSINGNSYEMIIPFDTENGKSYASEREILGRRTFNIFGSVVDADGRPGRPSLQITFFVKDGEPDLVSIEVFDDEGWRKPLSIGSDVGNGDFTDFQITADNRITARFAGAMLRTDTSNDRNPTVLSDNPVAIEGTFSVSVPAGS